MHWCRADVTPWAARLWAACKGSDCASMRPTWRIGRHTCSWVALCLSSYAGAGSRDAIPVGTVPWNGTAVLCWWCVVMREETFCQPRVRGAGARSAFGRPVCIRTAWTHTVWALVARVQVPVHVLRPLGAVSHNHNPEEGIMYPVPATAYGVPRGCRPMAVGPVGTLTYVRKSDGAVVGTLVFTVVNGVHVGAEFVPAKPYRLDWGFSPLTEDEQALVSAAVYAWLPDGEEVTEVFGDWDGWGWEPNEDGIVSVDVTVHTTEGAWLLNVSPEGEVVYEDFASFAEADLGRSI